MIIYKTKAEIALMRDAGQILSLILHDIIRHAVVGASTYDLEEVARGNINKHKVKSAFLGYAYPPYPAVLCTSINDTIVHGIPSKEEVLKDGDIIGIDFGIFYKDFCADAARTVCIGNVSLEAQKLVDTTQKALNAGIERCTAGNRLGDIGHAIETIAKENNFSVVTVFGGHGIGRSMHEDPQLIHVGPPGQRARLNEGLCLAIEPQLNIGSPNIEIMPDCWTAKTTDGSLSAHFEDTIAIIEGLPVILTR